MLQSTVVLYDPSQVFPESTLMHCARRSFPIGTHLGLGVRSRWKVHCPQLLFLSLCVVEGLVAIGEDIIDRHV